MNPIDDSAGKEELPEKTDAEEYPEPEYLNEEITGPMRIVAWIQEHIGAVTEKYGTHIKWAIFFVILVLFHVWLGMIYFPQIFRKVEIF